MVTFPVEQLTFTVEPLVFGVTNADGSVIETEDEVTLRSDVFFDYNQAVLNTKSRAALETVATKLNRTAPKALLIEGHTDSDGAEPDNIRLSQQRADAVRAFLATKLPRTSLSAVGRGETKPVADNATAEGRAANRRVTITTVR